MRSRLMTVMALIAPASGVAQQTRPERTGGAETSTLADVNAFIDSLGSLGGSLRAGVFGRSGGGQEIRYLIAGRPLVLDPAEAHRSGKPIIYLQGNIHGGEVEGKEASLMLLRDLTVGDLRPLLDSVILIVVPVYNADGNETWGSRRPEPDRPKTAGRRPQAGPRPRPPLESRSRSAAGSRNSGVAPNGEILGDPRISTSNLANHPTESYPGLTPL